MSDTPARPGNWTSFGRSQLASAAATAADYGVVFGLTELFRVWYVASTALGAITGGVLNFLINRYWSFGAGHLNAGRQVWRYCAVSGASLLLNCGGVWLMTELGHLHYAVSVVTVSLIVGWGFNYPLFRHYVFAR